MIERISFITGSVARILAINAIFQLLSFSASANSVNKPHYASNAELSFCSEWNPAFAQYGNRCCPRLNPRDIRRPCPEHRRKQTYCDEVMPFQKEYSKKVLTGEISDILTHISLDFEAEKKQAHCQVSNGFLAYGRPVVPTPMNRILINKPDRCTNFGTDKMAEMLEWLGRRIAIKHKNNTGIRLVLGDISAPKGGCLSGRGGRRIHISHTSGLDVDIAFFNVKKGQKKLDRFSIDFVPESNWWFIKKLFKNPFACVKVVLLDQALIKQIQVVAKNDPQWKKLSPFLRHARDHKDHYHVRIGEHAGAPGCPLESIEVPS